MGHNSWWYTGMSYVESPTLHASSPLQCNPKSCSITCGMVMRTETANHHLRRGLTSQEGCTSPSTHHKCKVFLTTAKKKERHTMDTNATSIHVSFGRNRCVHRETTCLCTKGASDAQKFFTPLHSCDGNFARKVCLTCLYSCDCHFARKD